MSLVSLPNELLYMIGEHMVMNKDVEGLANLCQTSRHFALLFRPQRNTLTLHLHAPKLDGIEFFEAYKVLLANGATVRRNPWIHSKTPLHHAVDKRNLDAVRLLLGNGANPNIWTDIGKTALDIAVWNCDRRGGREFEVVKMLLQYGARPDVATPSMLPLQYAVQHIYVRVAKALLEAGADVNRRDGRGNGRTPIFEAKSLTMMRLLLEKGADPCILTFHNESAIFNLRFEEIFHTSMPTHERNTMIDLLVSKGCTYQGEDVDMLYEEAFALGDETSSGRIDGSDGKAIMRWCMARRVRLGIEIPSWAAIWVPAQDTEAIL